MRGSELSRGEAGRGRGRAGEAEDGRAPLHLERRDAMHPSRVKDVARLGLAQVHVKHRHAVGHLVQVLGAVGAEERAGDGVEAQEDLVRLRRRRQLLGLGEQRARRAAVDGEDLAVGGGLPLLRVLRLVAHAGIAAVLGEFLVGDALAGRRV